MLRPFREWFMRGRQLAIVLGMTLCAWAAFDSAAQACPMCSQSIAEESHLPRAYMYSILFMLSMPAIVFSGICVCIYRTMKTRPHLAPQAAVPESGERISEAVPISVLPELTVQ